MFRPKIIVKEYLNSFPLGILSMRIKPVLIVSFFFLIFVFKKKRTSYSRYIKEFFIKFRLHQRGNNLDFEKVVNILPKQFRNLC